MNTILRFAFAMLAAISLVSCHSTTSKEAGKAGLAADSTEQAMYQNFAEAHRLDSIGEHAAAFMLRERTLAAYRPNTVECLQYKGIRCSLENKTDSASIYFARCEKMCDDAIRDSLDINAVIIKAFVLIYTSKQDEAKDFLQQLRHQHPHETCLEQLYRDFDVIKETASKFQSLRLSRDMLRLVIGDKESAVSDSAEPVRLKHLSDYIVIKYNIENTTQWHYTYLSDEYWIERQVDGEWVRMPNDFGSTLMGKEIPAHSSVTDSAKVSLEAGHYRFCNTAYPDDARIDNEKNILRAEFEIE